jgi:hypothetical protein
LSWGLKSEREKERASDQARSVVVDRKEEEGRNNFAADRFASQEKMREIPSNEREREKKKSERPSEVGSCQQRGGGGGEK